MKNTHYIKGSLAIVLALAILPFSLILMQSYILPVVGNKLLGGSGQSSESTNTEVAGKEINLINTQIRGNLEKAEIVMIEFSDYECYFCNKFHPTIKSVFEKSNGKIVWGYKHFPLEQIHPNARPAAIAAECVAKLSNSDNFWKYTDTLIENNKNFSTQYFKTEAIKSGINASAYDKCTASPEILKVIDEHMKEGTGLGINGTPNTVIAKKEGDEYVILESINGALDENAVQSIVNKYIK